MNEFNWKPSVSNFDARRDLVMPGDKNQTIDFCTHQLIEIAQEAISSRGEFFIALSGGSTPNAIYQKLSQPPFKDLLDWSKVFLFWGDERSVRPNDTESNYHNSMLAGLNLLPIPEANIFRMKAEENIEENALAYEQLIRKKIPNLSFDLIMLGMGQDGHTASLFPETHGLHANNRLVIANYIPQKQTWRMSLTYECIHAASQIVIYVIGKNKAEMVKDVLIGTFQPDVLPIQRIGTSKHKALWVLDTQAAEKLIPALGLEKL